MKRGNILFIILIAITIVTYIGLRKYTEFQREHYLKPKIAQNNITKIMNALLSYKMQQTAYPSTSDYQDFLQYRPDKIYKNEIPTTDPWGNKYIYISPGPKNLPYRISSYGADGMEGGIGKKQDINSDEKLSKLLSEIN
jgi:general secretion pathway protein G